MNYSLSKPLFAILLLLMIYQTHQDCLNLCYSRDSGKGQCDICYYECSHSSEAYFTSCHYENQETGQILDLTESQCYSYCYPEILHQLKTLEKVSEKLDIAEGVSNPSPHQISNAELQEQLKKDEHDTNIMIFIMASGCAFFTVLAIILIIRFFESKDSQQKATIQTKYFQSEQKDLPDINIDSSSSYYPQSQDGTKQLNL